MNTVSQKYLLGLIFFIPKGFTDSVAGQELHSKGIFQKAQHVLGQLKDDKKKKLQSLLLDKKQTTH